MKDIPYDKNERWNYFKSSINTIYRIKAKLSFINNTYTTNADETGLSCSDLEQERK